MTPRATFPVAPGQTITAAALGPLIERPFPGIAAPLEDRVDYRFVNGNTDVGDLPCRIATWQEIAKRDTLRLAPFEITAVQMPGFGARLDFSSFWHLPTRLSRWLRTRLIPDTQGPHRFKLATPGGVNIWVDGAHVCAHEPFTRNTSAEIEITLPLSPGGSDVVLLMEEMAERDTQFFAALTWQGPGPLTAEIPVAADPQSLTTLMDLARDIRPARVVFTDGAPLTLLIDNPASEPVTVAARIPRSVHLKHLPPLFTGTATLPAGQTRVTLPGTEDAGDGYHPLHLTLSIGETRVERQIAFARLETAPLPYACHTPASHKAYALEQAASGGEPAMGRLLAMMATGREFDATAQDILTHTLDAITTRRDCSDFILVPLLWLMTTHRDTLPEAAQSAAKAAILGYRYWMDEPGNDAMWFWSENHVLCFHVSQYLAGKLFPDHIFPNSGKTGVQQQALAEVRLSRWFDAIDDHGLAEWNSAAYYPIDFIGIFALYHLAEPALSERAKEVLDRLFTMIALHTTGGVPAGSMGRAYDKELRAGPLTELAPFAALAFGEGWLGPGVAALPMYCLSDYTPPATLTRLAAPSEATKITAHYTQGHGAQARLSLYKTAHLQLSTATSGTAGTRGHQQHLIDVQFAAKPFARAWINHPGVDDPWSENRPSYWSGNGIMPRVAADGPIALALFDTTGAQLEYTHAYAPASEFDAVRHLDDTLILVSGKGVLILKATAPITPVNTGPGAGIEWRCHGPHTGWAAIATTLPSSGMDALIQTAKSHSLSIHPGPLLALTCPGAADLCLSWTDGLTRGGTPLPFPTSSTLPQILETRA